MTRLHLYTFAWNEAVLVPFFLQHYRPDLGWERIIVYDHHSTDGTPDLLRVDPRVEVRTYGVPNEMSDDLMMDLRNQVWKESRGAADWVYTPDFDEFLHHHELQQFLEYVPADIVIPTGYDMATTTLPNPAAPIIHQVRMGQYNPQYSKPTLFRPAMVHDIRFDLGAHNCEPFGPTAEILKPYRSGNAKILHYKRLGLAYYTDRIAVLGKRLTFKPELPRRAKHSYYFATPAAHVKSFRDALANAVDVIT